MRKEKYKSFEALTLRNNLVGVTVLPELQGRVIEYASKSTGHNHVWDNLSSEYGIMNAGIMSIVKSDTLSHKWKVLMNEIPMNWDGIEYVLEEKNSSRQVLIKAQGSGLELEQKCQILNDSPVLFIQVRLKNESKDTVKVQLNIRGSWTVGGAADDSDTLVVSKGNGLLKHRYTGDNYQQSVNSSKNWAAISDSRTKESVLMVGDDNLLVYHIYILSHKKAYNLEGYSGIRYLRKGETMEFGMRFYTLKMGSLDYFDDNIAAGFDTNQDFYLQPESINCLVSLGSPHLQNKGIKGEATVSLMGQNQVIIQKRTLNYSLSPADLLSGYSSRVFFATQGLPDGKYTLKLRQSGNGFHRESQIRVNLVGTKMKEMDSKIKNIKSSFLEIIARLKKDFRKEPESTSRKLPECIGLWMRLKNTEDMLWSGQKKGFSSDWQLKAIEKQIAESMMRITLLNKQNMPAKNSPFSLVQLTRDCLGTLVYETSYQEDVLLDNLGIYYHGIPVLPNMNIKGKIESKHPIGLEDIPKPINSELPLQIEGIKDLLSFDFSSSGIVTDSIGKDVTERIASILGGKILNKESFIGKQIVLIGHPNKIHIKDKLLRKIVMQIKLPIGNGLLKYFKIEDKEVVLILGRQKKIIDEVGQVLLDIVKFLKCRKLYCGDLHCHTNLSDGKYSPIYSVFGAICGHLDFLAITDHNEVEGSILARNQLEEIGFDYPLILGQEIQRKGDSNTHVLILDYDKNINLEKEWSEIIDIAHKNQALAVLAHPLKNVNSSQPSLWQMEALRDWKKLGLDGFEVIEGEFENYYKKWEEENVFPLLMGNSDNHNVNFSVPVRTLVFASEGSHESIFQAIRENNCLAYCRDNVYGRPEMINVFKALVQERKYLEEMHQEKLVRRTKQLLHIFERMINTNFTT